MLDLTPGTQEARESRADAGWHEPASRGSVVECPDAVRAADVPSLSAVKSYTFMAALRPFSLVVAFVSCGLGIVLALPLDSAGLLLASAVMLGGLLLQCGVNLINDREDLGFLHGKGFDAIRRQVERNFHLGLLSFAVAGAIGVGIASYSGYAVLVIGFVGVLGAFAYTHEPFNYKRRGLGVVCVFVLMGVLMVQGSYIAITGELSLSVLLHSLPVSALVSLLLLGNELRDLEKDAARGVKTLSVALGYERAVRLYWLLLGGTYLVSGLLIAAGELPLSPWLLLPLPLLPLLRYYLAAHDRTPLTPWTGRFLLLFGVGYTLALV
ncbi:MAG: prenyltransferase [Gammaproteobacteria bacterium]|nr:prenyltransferase [Gammaproteobacteria bacterium]